MDFEQMRGRLVEARERAGYNRKSFAEAMDIPYRTITNYENGSREPGSDYLAKVADKCGCSTDWLLGLSDAFSAVPPVPVLDPLLSAVCRCFDDLNQEGRERLAEYADDLVCSGKYIKSRPAEMAKNA